MKTNIFKRGLSMIMTLLMVLSCWVWFEPVETVNAANLTGDSNYLFAYFTGTSIEGQTIHLAISRDGLNYTALRGNEPVIVPSKGTGCVRDPYLWYNERDGYYYILATDLDFTDTGSDYSDNSESFIIWRSKDLVNWYDETMIDVKAMSHLIGNTDNMQAVWAPQVLHDGTSYVVYFSLQCEATKTPWGWNNLQIVYLRTTDLFDQNAYYEYGVIHDPERHVIDADIIKKPGTDQYYMFYKDESASGGIQSIYYMISDNGPTGPYYAPNNANEGRGPQLFSEIGKNLEGCNSFFDDNGNLVTFVDEYDYTNSSGQKEAHFHICKTSDFNTFTTITDSHNINSLSPRHGSVVKITDEEYNRLLQKSSQITSSSFSETEKISDHLVGRYFTTSDYTYNAATGNNDLQLTDGTISATSDAAGNYYAYFNAAGAEINLAQLIRSDRIDNKNSLDDLNIKDGFTITFSASASSNLGANARFFDISNNWSQRTNPNEVYLHMSPVADSNGLYVGAYNGPVTTSSWTWASQGRNYNDDVMHDYVISFADGNMILYIDGELAMKRDRFNMNAEYGDNFLNDNWYKEIGNSTMRIGKSEWSDPLFTGSIQNLCIYDCSLSYYDVQTMEAEFAEESGNATTASIAVPETVYLAPSTGTTTNGQYYVNNTFSNSNIIKLDAYSNATSGILQLYVPGMEDFKFNVTLKGETDGVDVITNNVHVENTYMAALNFPPAPDGSFGFTGLNINLKSGISAGDSRVAEWKFTIKMKDGSETTHYAYTTLYAPNYHSVGATAEARYNTSNRVDGAGWISGIHTVSTAIAPFGKSSGVDGQGAFKSEPLLNLSKPMTPQDWGSANNLTASPDGLIYAREYYRNSSAGSNEQSPVGILYVDYSRNKNTNTIPNVYVGAELLKADSGNNDDTHFYSYYTLGTGSEFQNPGDDSRPSGWTQFMTLSSSGGSHTGTVASTLTISDLSNFVKVLKDANSGRSLRIYTAPNLTIKETGTQYIYLHAQIRKNDSKYANMYSAVQIFTVDKSSLRNLVLKATYLNESDYTTDSWSAFQTALQNAASALGNPTRTDIANVKNELETKMNALQTTVTLDANGGSINGSSFNVTVGAETTVDYDLSKYIPERTGYDFKGWATTADAENGSTTVHAGLMPTFYATWEIDRINITYDNIIDFEEWNKSAVNGTVSDVTDTGFAVTTKSGFKESYSYSRYFEIEPGKQYIVQMDIIGDAWDVYFFFCDKNGSYVKFSDTENRFSSNGTGISFERNGDNVSAVFTVPSDSSIVNGQLRLDANNSDNKVTFDNIRVSECYDVKVNPANMFREYGEVFGTLPTPTRRGYEFAGWFKGGTQYTASSIMSETSTLELHSEWTENSYTLKYDTNGGTGSVPADQTLKYSENVKISSTALTRTGYIHKGWSTTPDATSAMYQSGQTVNGICGDKNGTVTLYAVWEKFSVNVTFDNMFDFNNFQIGTALTVDERTNTGFIVTSKQEDGNTGFSEAIPVEPGKTYILSAEIRIECIAGDTKGYDMYIHTLDANKAGETTATVDTSNGARREGDVYISLTGQKIGASVPYIRFTAGENTRFIKIRFDANTPGNKLSVNNIRFYEDTGITVSPVNKYVDYGTAIGDMPTPVRPGYDFEGWYQGNTLYTADTVANTTSTVYLTSKWTIGNSALVTDAYVLDFGVKAEFKPLENDLNDVKSYNISGISTDGTTTAATVNGAYGTFTLSNNTVTYVPTAIMNGVDIAYYHVNVGGKVIKGEMRVYPATVVYFEDDVDDAVDYRNGISADKSTGEWTTTGTSQLASATQNLADKIYGYTDAYKNSSDNFSMGSAHVVSVSAKNNPNSKYSGSEGNKWPEAEFTFAGTGFDVVSLISKDTGSVNVIVKKDGTQVYNWIIDTYYGYTYENGEWVVSAANNTMYQIPVIGKTDMPYGTYTVTIIPTYSSRLDHAKDGAYDFYIDAIRVYNPMQGDIDAETLYLNDGEYVVEHKAIRDILIDADNFGESNEGVVYINQSMPEGTFEQYSKAGPKNEVYLAKNQSVAFSMTVSGFTPTSVQISAHALNGTASMRFGSGASYSIADSISHKTTLYYEVPFTDAGYYWNDNGDGSYTLSDPIVITNNGDGILSLCNIKVTSDVAVNVEPLMFMMNDDDFNTAVYSVGRMSTLTEDDGALFVPDDMISGADNEVVETGDEVVVTINTSSEVYALTVNGEDATLVSVNEDGSKVWNYTFITENRGEQTFTLVAYDVHGFASEEQAVTVDVQSKIEIFFNKISKFISMIIEFLNKLVG